MMFWPSFCFICSWHIAMSVYLLFLFDGLGIYVNKNLRLDNIQVYGFDYDYTLAHYSPNLQQLIYDLAKEHMVNEVRLNFFLLFYKFYLMWNSVTSVASWFIFWQFRYPETCLKFRYDQTFPIRGLSYDKKNGCLLKLDFFGSIEPDGCYFGRRKVPQNIYILLYFLTLFIDPKDCR